MRQSHSITDGDDNRCHIQISVAQPELQSVASTVEAFCVAKDIPQSSSNLMNLALDEILSNIIKFAYDASKSGLIDVDLTYSSNRFIATVEDAGRPFNPLQIPRHVSSEPLKDRRQGGLGIIFVTSLLDSVTYDRTGERNRLMLTIKVPSGQVSEEQ